MHTLDDVQRGLSRSSDELRNLLAPLRAERLLWQEQPSSWSITHCLEHLRKGNDEYLGAILQAVSRNPGRHTTNEIHPRLIERLLSRELEPPPKRRLPAPRKIVPRLTGDVSEMVRQFWSTQQRLDDFVASCRQIDFNHIRFRNPFIPILRFSVGGGLLVLDAHYRRHVWQMKRLRANPAFPK